MVSVGELRQLNNGRRPTLPLRRSGRLTQRTCSTPIRTTNEQSSARCRCNHRYAPRAARYLPQSRFRGGQLKRPDRCSPPVASDNVKLSCGNLACRVSRQGTGVEHAPICRPRRPPQVSQGQGQFRVEFGPAHASTHTSRCGTVYLPFGQWRNCKCYSLQPFFTGRCRSAESQPLSVDDLVGLLGLYDPFANKTPMTSKTTPTTRNRIR